MAGKLFWGAFVAILVKFTLADEVQFNPEAFRAQVGRGYFPATNQQQDQLKLPTLLQSGFNEKYGSNSYVPPLGDQTQYKQSASQSSREPTGQVNTEQDAFKSVPGQRDLLPPTQWQQSASQNSGQPSQVNAEQFAINSVPGQKDLPPPILPGSNKFYNQGSLKLPEGNGLPGPKVLPPEGQKSSNVFYSQASSKLSESNKFLGQGNLPPPIQQDPNSLYSSGALPGPGSNQFAGQGDFPLPFQQASDTSYVKNTLSVPGSNQFSGQGDFPPPLQQASDTSYVKNTLSMPGSNQFAGQGDFPPPLQQASDALYAKNALPVPGGNQLLGTDDLPQGMLPGSNSVYDQNKLQLPGSNQFHGAEELIPPSLNTLNGQNFPRLSEDSELPRGDYLPPPVPPSSGAFNDQTALNPPESNHRYGLDTQLSPADANSKIPYGNDVAAPPGDNQFGVGGGEPPVLTDLKIPYGEDALVPPAGDTSPVSNTDDGLKSPSESVIDDNSSTQDSDSEDDNFSETYSDTYFSSVLGGLGVGGAGSLYSESDGGSNEFNVDNWDSFSNYDSYGIPQEGENFVEDSFLSSDFFSSQVSSLQFSGSEFLNFLIDKLQNDKPVEIPHISRTKRAISSERGFASSSNNDQISSQYSSYSNYDANSSESDSNSDLSNGPDAYRSYDSYSYPSLKSNYDAYPYSYDIPDADSSSISSDVNSSDSRSDANLSSSSDAYPSFESFSYSSSYSKFEAYSYDTADADASYDKTTKTHSDSVIAVVISTLMGNGTIENSTKMGGPSEEDSNTLPTGSSLGYSTATHSNALPTDSNLGYSTATHSNALPTDSNLGYSTATHSNALPTGSSLGYSTATPTNSLLDKLTVEDMVGSSSYDSTTEKLVFENGNYISDIENTFSNGESYVVGPNVLTGGEPDQKKDKTESAVIASTTAWIQPEWSHATDPKSFPPQGTKWEPSGAGKAAQQEAGDSYPPRTRLRPMGTSYRENNIPAPTSLAVYCIPVVLLVILILLVRSNSYFKQSPKVVIVDPESRNRDIDAKAKEIEPLLRESMEYKNEDEIN